jgi:type II secretory ATPase GspE/PulE/Tfp pilus assembly ATPase PilB-like protein
MAISTQAKHTTQNTLFQNQMEQNKQPAYTLIHTAAKNHASDIHLDPYLDHYRVRFRVDGHLSDKAHLKQTTAMRIIAQLKVSAELDISKSKVVQEGALSMPLNQQGTQRLSCRVSLCPTIGGERAAIRLMPTHKAIPELDHLGWLPDQALQLKHHMTKKKGLLIITGPTGSGKTTTLYALLKALAQREENIITVEDPVEMPLESIHQINLNDHPDLNENNLLPALLRQDPDIIMIGETRRQETLNMALTAAQTGHWVMTTLHSQNTLTALMRILHLGCDAQMLRESADLIIAQRLVRRLCAHCKTKATIDEDHYSACLGYDLTSPALEALSILPTLAQPLYQAVGCPACCNGYLGRIPIFELLPFDKTIKRLMHDHIQPKRIKDHLTRSGWISLQQSIHHHLREGNTSLDEVFPILCEEMDASFSAYNK